MDDGHARRRRRGDGRQRKVDGHLALTLIGIRDSGHNEIVTGVLDVDPDDEAKLASEVPRTDDGTSLPLDQLRPG